MKLNPIILIFHYLRRLFITHGCALIKFDINLYLKQDFKSKDYSKINLIEF